MPANLEWIDDYPEEDEQDVVICLNKGLLDGKFPIITEHTNIGDILLIEAMADSTGIPDSTLLDSTLSGGSLLDIGDIDQDLVSMYNALGDNEKENLLNIVQSMTEGEKANLIGQNWQLLQELFPSIAAHFEKYPILCKENMTDADLENIVCVVHDMSDFPVLQDDDSPTVTGVRKKFSIKYVHIWDESMWKKYDRNANEIAEQRRSCVLPRGVLGKIWTLVSNGVPTNEVLAHGEDGKDFPWFKQANKEYGDQAKGVFSKYANLHIGRAYEVMSARDYHFLTGNEQVDGKYVKPEFGSNQNALSQMILAGCKALEDAFSVMKDKRVFNIWNSESQQVEQYVPKNAKHYSQSQCALVIERVFSELYKYLQFKSTTGEVFQRHVNVDSGYKYLTTESILASDNPNSHAYYDSSDEVPYLRYLTKLQTYLNVRQTLLTPDQYVVLSQFVEVLSEKSANWIEWQWDFCP